MKQMHGVKRILAMLLCAAMLISLFPEGAVFSTKAAAEDVGGSESADPRGTLVGTIEEPDEDTMKYITYTPGEDGHYRLQLDTAMGSRTFYIAVFVGIDFIGDNTDSDGDIDGNSLVLNLTAGTTYRIGIRSTGWADVDAVKVFAKKLKTFEIEDHVLLGYYGDAPSVTIPEGVTRIGEGAFSGNSELHEVIIPEGVTHIDGYAFAHCNYLYSVTVPKSLQAVDENAFSLCYRLFHVYYNGTAEQWSNIRFADDDDALNNAWAFGMLPSDSMTALSEGENNVSFNSYDAKTMVFTAPADGTWNVLATFNIPESDEEEDDGGLLEVTLLSNDRWWLNDWQIYYSDDQVYRKMTLKQGEKVYFYCENYFGVVDATFSIAEPKDSLIIDGVLLDYNGDKTNVVIPDNVRVISTTALDSCRSEMESVTLPTTLDTIQYAAFDNCINLKTVNYSGNEEQWQNIGIFRNNDPLLAAKYPGHDAVGTAGLHIYWTKDGSTLSLHGRGDTFYGMKWTADITKIATLVVNEGITELKEEVFANFVNAASVTIPATVETIDYRAFFNCDSLETLNYAGGGEGWVQIYVAPGNDKLVELASQQWNLMSFLPELHVGTTEVTAYSKITYRFAPEESGAYIIRSAGDVDTVCTLKDDKQNVLEDNDDYNDMNFRVMHHLDAGQTYLVEIGPYDDDGGTFDVIVEKLDSDFYVVDGCLTAYFGNDVDVIIPEDVTCIGEEVFRGHKEIQSVAFPAGLEDIEGDAFRNCTNLNSVSLYGENASWNKISIFSGNEVLWKARYPEYNLVGGAGRSCAWLIDEDGTLIIRGAGMTFSYEDEEANQFWRNHNFNNVVIEEGITGIGECCFAGLMADSVWLPSTIEEIDANAFKNCYLSEASYAGEDWDSVDLESGNEKLDMLIRKISEDSIQSIVVGDNTIPYTSEENVIFSSFTPEESGYYGFRFRTEENVHASEGYLLRSDMSVLGVDRTGERYFIMEELEAGQTYLLKTKIDVCDAESFHVDVRKFDDDFIVVDGILLKYTGNQSEVIIPDDVNYIDYGAFENNTNITKVTIPDGVYCLNDYAFSNCTELQEITIPLSMEDIGSCAFEDCDSLKTLKYAGGREDWLKIRIGGGNDCLSKLMLGDQMCGSNVVWAYNDGTLTFSGRGLIKSYWELVVEDEDNRPWAEYASDITSVVIGEGIQAVGVCVCYDMPNLKTVTIPRTIYEIGEYAFGGCNALETVYYGGSRQAWNEVYIDCGNDALYDANIDCALSVEKMKALQLNVPETVQVKANTEEFYSFTPAQTGLYAFRWESEEFAEMRLRLYDSEMNQITSDTSLRVTLEAGVSYAVSVENITDNDLSVILTVSADGETSLQERINALEPYGVLTIRNENIELSENESVCLQQKGLELAEGAMLTVPEGCALFNQGWIDLTGGYLQVDGSYDDDQGMASLTYHAEYYDSDDASSGTNVDASLINYERWSDDMSVIRTILSQETGIPYQQIRASLGGMQTLDEDLTIPAGRALVMYGNSSLTIPEDVTLTIAEGAELTMGDYASMTLNGILVNNGKLNLWGENTITGTGEIQGDGEITGNLDGIQLGSQAEPENLEDLLAAEPGDTLAIVNKNVVLTKDLTLTKGIWLGQNGRLEIDEKAALTNEAWIDLGGGYLNVDGTYNGEGSLTYHPEQYSEDNLALATNLEANVIAYEYGTNDMSVARQVLAQKMDIPYQEIRAAMTGTVTLDGDLTISAGRGLSLFESGHLTIPEGKTLTVESNASLTVANDAIVTVDGTLINNGCLHLWDNGTINGSGELQQHGDIDGDPNKIQDGLIKNEAEPENLQDLLAAEQGESLVIENKTVVLSKDLTLTKGIWLGQNGRLEIDEKAALTNEAWIDLGGGYLNVDGTYNGEGSLTYHPEQYPEDDLSLATDLPASQISYEIVKNDMDDIRTALMPDVNNPYHQIRVVVDGTKVLGGKLTVPAGRALCIYSTSSLTIQAGETLTVDDGAELVLGNEASMTVTGTLINKGRLYLWQESTIGGTGNLINVGYVDAHEDRIMHIHTFGQPHEAADANCVDAGNIAYYDCGNDCEKKLDDDYNVLTLEEVTIDAPGHTWATEYTVDQKATCTEPGSKSIHCTVCGASDGNAVAIPAAHKWGDDYTVDVEATCTDPGSKSYHCTVCGESDGNAVEIPVKDHTWATEYTIDREATCTETGSKSYHCTVCGESDGNAVTIPGGHKWASDYTIDKQPDCTTDGSKSIHCTVCGEPDGNAVVISGGHKWASDYTIDKQPDCTTDGSKSIHCTVCGESDGNAVAIPGGHKWAGDYTIDKQPDCTTDGSKSYHCTVCGESDGNAVTIPGGHKWASDYTIDKAPTATEPGSKSYHCTVCGESDGNAVVIPAKGETFTITYVLNGGKNASGNPATYSVNGAAITLKDPTRRGYTFGGWHKDSAFTTKVTGIPQGSEGDITLYAKWNIITYKITYKLNKGKNNAKNRKTFTVNSAAITLRKPTRKGYKFLGWYKDAKFKNKITKIPKGTVGNLKLYAKWKKA